MRRILLLLCLPALAFAQTPPSTDELRRPWEAQQEKAAAMRRQASALRDAAAHQREQDDYACNSAFLYNHCLEKSRDRALEQIGKAREIEAEAHVIDTEAKRNLLAIRDAELPRPPSPAAASTPVPAIEPRQPQPTAKPLPPPQPVAAPKPTGTLPAERATQETRRVERQRERQREAAERAAKAREDAARYDEKLREINEKKAKRAATPPKTDPVPPPRPAP